MKNDLLRNEMPRSCFKIAAMELALHLYMFYETDTDRDCENYRDFYGMDGVHGLMDRMFELIDNTVLCEEEFDREAYLKKAYELREDIKAEATGLSSISDLLAIYEYVLNRINPDKAAKITDFNDDAAARDVLSAIFADKDNSMINTNIRLALSQLPIRMTKARFFDILENGLKKYIGGDCKALTQAVFVITCGCGCSDLSAINENGAFGISGDELRKLEAADYTGLTAVQYNELESIIKKASTGLKDYSEAFENCIKAVNLICVYLEGCNVATEADRKMVEPFKAPVSAAVSGIRSAEYKEMDGLCLNAFKLSEDLLINERDNLEGINSGLGRVYNTKSANDITIDDLALAARCTRLLSDSYYADLDASDEAAIASTEDAAEEFNRLKSALENKFANDCRPVQRARMAAVISNLPLFFESRSDVMNYVNDSVSNCRDTYEKSVAVNLVLENIRSF